MRTIVIGIDGADPARLLSDDRRAHLRALKDAGAFRTHRGDLLPRPLGLLVGPRRWPRTDSD